MITLTDFCGECRNYFIHGASDIHIGTYEISGGRIQPLDFLAEGQYFRIVGSMHNDGVWLYPFDDLRDETFSGAVWAMSVPREVEELVREIDGWTADNSAAIKSPYQSESFGGYSYQKPYTGGASISGVTWQGQYGTRINRWRKLREI